MWETFLVLVLLAIVYISVYFLRVRFKIEFLETLGVEVAIKNQIARTAVTFVQQAYKELSNTEKYKKAEEWFLDACKAMGIKIDLVEVKGYIENALFNQKHLCGRTWKTGTIKGTTND